MFLFKSSRSVSSDKLNILGAKVRSIKKNREKPQKIEEKTGIFTQTQFLT